MRITTPLLSTAAAGATLVAALGFAGTAAAVKFAGHGHLDHRFTFLDTQTGFLVNNTGRGPATLNDEASDNLGELKYRIWGEAETDDSAIKGVYAFEVGGIDFGRAGSVGKSVGGGFSGDAVNVETRWAYTDFAIPIAREHRVRVGLQPHEINRHVWKETALGVKLTGPLSERLGYKFTWMRGEDEFRRVSGAGFADQDNFSGHLNFDLGQGHDVEGFVLYQRDNQDGSSRTAPTVVSAQNYGVKNFPGANFDIFTFGGTGSHDIRGWDVDWHAMYQTGDIDNVSLIAVDTIQTGGAAPAFTGDADLGSFFGRLDVGRKFRGTKWKYTFWYASGDDDPANSDFDAFLATDVDMTESAIFFEGKPTSDDFFTERPYVFDKGLIFNMLQASRKVTDKLTLTGSVSYLQTAEELTYVDDNGVTQSQDSLGFELQGKAAYQLYKNMKLTAQAAYLVADDGMDFFETGSGVARDGSSDEDIFAIYGRLEYRF